MKEKTLEITQYCPHGDCDYCSSNASPEGKHVPEKEVFKALDEITERVDILIISGGEPLFHPSIGEILWRARLKARKVKLYTNMIDCLVYNTDKIKDIEVEANVCMVAGKAKYLPKPTIEVRTHLLKLVHHGRAKELPQQNITASRNFLGASHCNDCEHTVLQADGKTVEAPCKKNYSYSLTESEDND